MAQCEGDLSTGDCGQCVTQAVQHVEVECGGAPSGQVYLDKCYISYSYYPHGVPHGRGGQFPSPLVAYLLISSKECLCGACKFPCIQHSDSIAC